MRDHSNREKIKIHSIKFTKVESSLDIANYMKGGRDSKLNDITIEAEVETNVDQQKLDELHLKVVNSCPVYQMISGSGVKIINNWKNIQKP